MKKADQKRLLFIVSISLIVFLSGCVDTNVNNIPSTLDSRSQVNVVNLVAGMGSATVTMKEASGAATAAGETISFGSIAFGDNSPANAFKDVPAGTKSATISYSGSSTVDNIVVNTSSNYRVRLFLVGDKNNDRVIVSQSQRYINTTKADTNLYPNGEAQVAIINASPDDTVNTFKIGSTSYSPSKALTLGGITSYASITPGQVTVSVTSGTGKTAQQSITLADQGRYTIVVYDYSNNLQLKILTDD